jgi:hypothetical protein
MSVSAVNELPVVGDRTPEIEELVSNIRSRLKSRTSATPVRQARSDKSQSSRSGFGPDVLIASSWGEPEFDLRLVVLVNTLKEKGSTTPGEVTRLVHKARTQKPARSVVVLLDEEDAEAVRAARVAGAFDFLGADEIRNVEAVFWRLYNATLLASVFASAKASAPEEPKKIRPLRVRRSARLSAARIREADAAIDAAVASLPTAEERRAHAADLLKVITPEFRDVRSGRLDARRIAEDMEMSIAALARAAGVSQQALSSKPDSPAAQVGLLPVARLSSILNQLFLPEHKRVWLQTPHPRFGDRSPIQAIEAGEAELVLLSVESARDGSPD